MRLLIRPLPLAYESRQGYVLRLSSLNGFDHPRWCVPLASAGDEKAARNATLDALTGHDSATLSTLRGPIFGLGSMSTRDSGNVGSRYWNTRCQRYCPICLAGQRYHRAIWGLTFGVACHEHSVWLRDDCPVCGQSVRWTGASLGKCSCGALLETAAALPCTENARSYVRMLASALHPGSTTAQAVSPQVPALTIDQLLRLTWFLGAYATRKKAKAQKISGIMHLDYAINMVEATAAMLLNWPSGFHALLDELGTKSDVATSGNKLSAYFGRFYHTLYRSFPEPSFAFLREGFEHYIVNHWSGQLAKRNQRFSAESRESHEWISIKEAARVLRTRTTRVKELVEKGQLVGRLFSTAKGRKMGSVLRDSVNAAVAREASLVTLLEARQILGLSKKRLHKLIAEGRLRAVRGPKVDGCPIWQFEKGTLAEATKVMTAPDSAPLRRPC
ncbi:TniQ family protein [Cupriavidus basilensis]|uniref:TniQ family protein n=1 Tax=Cupriavidus basilensis TaxID=68895 RepID=A0A7M2GV13_9BURK|nr:TniQ family protein [Cupriavidus basilensis]